MNELAGKSAPFSILCNIPKLMTDYYAFRPDVSEASQRVTFGTSGHRGVSSDCGFNENHIAAISQAVCDYRVSAKIDGPLFLGIDSHALSEAALVTAVEVLAANEVEIFLQKGGGYTPTPVISHAISEYNRERECGLADGIVVTPSHNPPEYGGFKYNEYHGGPASGDATSKIETAANRYLERGLAGVRRMPYNWARRKATYIDYVGSYVRDLATVIDMEAIQRSGLKMGVNPLGGATIDYWNAIADYYRLDITVHHPYADPAFSFMTADHDGKIRMDCSSPYAMASLIALKDDYDLAFGNDPDGDRHGVVVSDGLMNPNAYLSAMICYLYTHRELWPETLKVGKTLVSSAFINRVCAKIGRECYEVPVGFKWFVEGLYEGKMGFGGEESAGASFLKKDAQPWSTDKDGMIACLLAAEMTAVTGDNPAQIYAKLVAELGESSYTRIDTPASAEVRKKIKKLKAEDVAMRTLGGEEVNAILTEAPGNGASFGGIKIETENAWVALRPSGTEDIYKIYAESFRGADHLSEVIEACKDWVNKELH